MAEPHDDSKTPEKKADDNPAARPRPLRLPLIEVIEMREIEEKARDLAERSSQMLPEPQLPEGDPPSPIGDGIAGGADAS